MKISRFLRVKSIPLCSITFGLILWCILAVVAKIQWIFIALTIATVLFSTFLWLISEYFHIKKRLEKLSRLQKEIEEGYLLGEVLSKPSSTLEEEYFDIMKFISRSSIGKVETLMREQEEYREYVERWVHEIKTPLTACSLILANDGDKRKLKTELKRAENLAESILYHARMRTQALDTQITKTNLRETVEEAVVSEMELLLAAGVRIDIEGELTAYTDKKAVLFMLKQLLVNMAKYCPNSPIKITLNEGVICVEDCGPGIPSHELRRIFARGFVGEAGRKRGGGTGMGLYLVHELCAQLQIGLEVESELGKFTRFLLCFAEEGNLTKA